MLWEPLKCKQLSEGFGGSKGARGNPGCPHPRAANRPLPDHMLFQAEVHRSGTRSLSAATGSGVKRREAGCGAHVFMLIFSENSGAFPSLIVHK